MLTSGIEHKLVPNNQSNRYLPCTITFYSGIMLCNFATQNRCVICSLSFVKLNVRLNKKCFQLYVKSKN